MNRVKMKSIMDNATIKRIEKQARIRLKRLISNPETVKELVQEILLHYYEGKGNHQLINFATIDAVRKKFGATGSVYRRERNSLNYPGELFDIFSRDTPDHDGLLALVDCLDTRDRSYVILYFKWGFNYEEIAYLFGHTESQSAHILKEALERMRIRMKLADQTIKTDFSERRGKRSTAPRTHCKNGHAWIEAQIYRNPITKNETCRVCRQLTSQARTTKK